MYKKLLLCLILFNIHIEAMQEAFTEIYHTNLWGDPESISGSGSNLTQTATIRIEIYKLLKKYGIKTLLDAPCGDFNWMKKVDLSSLDYYYGVDIVVPIIEKNNITYADGKKQFFVADVTCDELPKVDLILCRDCLVHLRVKDIKKALLNFKKSGAKYLLTTTFTKGRKNGDFPHLVDWRPLNFQLPPFNFPRPLAIINEKCTEFNGAYPDKSLGLWRLEDINISI